MNDTLVQSVKKAMAILDILIFEDSENHGIGLFELARRLGQKPNTLHNIMKTMIFCGYVKQNDKSLYAAGPKCFDIVNTYKFTNKNGLIESIKPVLQQLAGRIGESVVLTMLINGNRAPIINVFSNDLIKVDFSLNEMSHIYEKPTGRILVSFADNYSFKLIKGKWGYPGKMWDDITDDQSFKKSMAEIRNRGYDMEIESKGTVISFAVPVKDSSGKFLYSLGSYAPLFRCGREKQAVILKELKEAATLIGQIL